MPGCKRGPQLAALVPGAAWPRRGKVARRNGKRVLQRRGEGDDYLVIAVSPSRCPSLLLLPPSLTPDRLGGLDEFPSGSDPKWGGETVTVPRGSSSRKFGG